MEFPVSSVMVAVAGVVVAVAGVVVNCVLSVLTAGIGNKGSAEGIAND